MPFRGTTRYASIAALTQSEQSRKDDLESLMYVVVEWIDGKLPWHHLTGQDKTEVLRMKELIRDNKDSLSDFLAKCPKCEFSRIFEHIHQLAYTNIPDYSFIYICLKYAKKVRFFCYKLFTQNNNINPFEPLDWDPETPYNGVISENRIIT